MKESAWLSAIGYSDLKLFTHKEKGGLYRLLGNSIGAGKTRGLDLVLYQDVTNGHLYHRKPADFEGQMVEVDDD